MSLTDKKDNTLGRGKAWMELGEGSRRGCEGAAFLGSSDPCWGELRTWGPSTSVLLYPS